MCKNHKLNVCLSTNFKVLSRQPKKTSADLDSSESEMTPRKFKELVSLAGLDVLKSRDDATEQDGSYC